MLYLNFLGSNGNEVGALKLSTKFGIGSGTVEKALLDIATDHLSWPSANEREEISAYMGERYGFPHCVGIVDGSLFPLAFKPSLHGEDYMSRKGGYGVNGMIICDHRARVIAI